MRKRFLCQAKGFVHGVLLVLDVERLRRELENLHRGEHDAARAAHVVLVEELEAGEFDRLILDEVCVCVDLVRGIAPAVEVHHDLHLGTYDDLLVIGDHALGEAVDDQYLRRQVVS